MQVCELRDSDSRMTKLITPYLGWDLRARARARDMASFRRNREKSEPEYRWKEQPTKDYRGNPVIGRWVKGGLTDEQRADAIEERKMADDLDTLYRRSEDGIRWLKEHDPDSSFHLWYEARIVPGAPMPAQSEERMAGYREYHHARDLWERIEARIRTIEAKA